MARLCAMSEISVADRKKLATELGLNEQYLYKCLTGRREMDPKVAMRTETETGGVLRRQMLCQKTFQQIWPDLQPLPDAANDSTPEAARG